MVPPTYAHSVWNHRDEHRRVLQFMLNDLQKIIINHFSKATENITSQMYASERQENLEETFPCFLLVKVIELGINCCIENVTMISHR